MSRLMSPTKSINKKMVENSGDFGKKVNSGTFVAVFFKTKKKTKKKQTEKDPERTFFSHFLLRYIRRNEKKAPKVGKEKKSIIVLSLTLIFPPKLQNKTQQKQKLKLN